MSLLLIFQSGGGGEITIPPFKSPTFTVGSSGTRATGTYNQAFTTGGAKETRTL